MAYVVIGIGSSVSKQYNELITAKRKASGLMLSFTIKSSRWRKRRGFKITDPKTRRFEVPHQHMGSFTGSAASNLNYIVDVKWNPFGIMVTRVRNDVKEEYRSPAGSLCTDTTIGPLQYADQFLQLSTKLPSSHIYGVGEHVHKQYRHAVSWKTWPMLSRDIGPSGALHNLHGVHTFSLCSEASSGASFGVFLMNSNAMDALYGCSAEVGKQYDVHSLYGYSMAISTQHHKNPMGLIIALDNNSAAPGDLFWDDGESTGMMEFSLFGIAYTGADISGFFRDSEYELCLRWMQLNAFYPYLRNHNQKGTRRQDPLSWNSAFEEISRNVLNRRYTLFPCFYTLTFDAHAHGSIVICPMLPEMKMLAFGENSNIYQLLWNISICISKLLTITKLQLELGKDYTVQRT